MPEQRPSSDQELLQRIQQQDQSALTTLYQRYGKLVYSQAYFLLKNQTLAEEATQDTFMKIWQGAAQWDAHKGQFSSWLRIVARYTAIDRLRQEKRQAGSDATSIEQVSSPTSKDGRPDDPNRHTGWLLESLLAEIPEEQAQAIQLAFFHGLTHRELAEKLSLPLGTVKKRVRSGLQKLKALWLESMRQHE
jgi:RNA polymerase sigma-70 factor (ECF subfamily)